MKNSNKRNNELRAIDIINKAGIDSPDDDFLDSTMEIIKHTPLIIENNRYDIFPKAFRFYVFTAIAGLIAVIIYFLLNIPTTSDNSHNSTFQMIDTFNKVIMLFFVHINIPLTIPIIFFTLFLFLFIDYYVNYRIKKEG